MEEILYEAKPYLCFFGGFAVAATLSPGSYFGIILMAAGAMIYRMRKAYRNGRSS